MVKRKAKGSRSRLGKAVWPGDWPGREWPPLGPLHPSSLTSVLNVLSQGRHLNFTLRAHTIQQCALLGAELSP